LPRGIEKALKIWVPCKDPINAKMDELVKVMESDSEYPGAYRKFKSEKGRKAAEEYDALIQQRSEIRNAPGYLYKGEIPDEILPSFLDWDKPLSQQSEEVRNALKPGLKMLFHKMNLTWAAMQDCGIIEAGKLILI
jgi:hypothetical protein